MCFGVLPSRLDHTSYDLHGVEEYRGRSPTSTSKGVDDPHYRLSNITSLGRTINGNRLLSVTRGKTPIGRELLTVYSCISGTEN